MIRLLALFTLLLSFSSCKKDDEKKEAPVAKSETADIAAKPSAVLVIKAAKLLDKSSDAPSNLVLGDDGSVKIGNKKVAMVSADGRVTDTKDKTLLTVEADGTLNIEGEEKLAITEDGTVRRDGQVIASFSEDGILTMEKLSDEIAYEGPKEARRAMMLAFLPSMMPLTEPTAPASVDAGADVKAAPVKTP